MGNYRQRIYDNYVSGFQGVKGAPPPSSSRRWAMAYRTYLHGWLPSEKTARILDVGCGSGNLLRHFKTLGYQNLHGVDISPEQVALARQGIPGVVEGNVFDYLDSASGQSDLIIGLDLVEHFNKDEVLRFLSACHKALRPGGRIILQTPNAESPWACSVRYGDFTHEVCFSPRLLARLLEMSGCRSIEAREAGPVARCGPSSAVRWLFWRLIRVPMVAWNIVETGNRGSGVFTRVFLISAVRA